MHSNNGLSKIAVQLALRDSGYAAWLRTLLLKDDAHGVLIVDKPDMSLEGIVVVDEDNFDGLSPILDPERFLVIVRKGTSNIPRIWDSGIRHVVFEEDSLQSTQLAIVAVEMKLAARRRSAVHEVSSTGPIQ